MNGQRAREILHETKITDVRLNGVSVWIDSVDGSGEMAKVFPKGHQENMKTVPVHQLTEL